MVSATIPAHELETLGELPSLHLARPVIRPLTNVGLVTTQDDAALLADDARAQFGVDGSGVKIGVLSDSFDCLAGATTDSTNGDLPAAGVTVLQELVGCAGTDEGRAMLQLVHDIAPGAELLFHTAFGGQAVFANGISSLRSAGADIIIDDVIYFAEPMFQDGIVAQAADTAVADGATFFSSAGNSGRDSYEAAFQLEWYFCLWSGRRPRLRHRRRRRCLSTDHHSRRRDPLYDAAMG